MFLFRVKVSGSPGTNWRSCSGVNSFQATQFGICATTTLRKFTAKGFVLDDKRLKKTNAHISVWGGGEAAQRGGFAISGHTDTALDPLHLDGCSRLVLCQQGLIRDIEQSLGLSASDAI